MTFQIYYSLIRRQTATDYPDHNSAANNHHNSNIVLQSLLQAGFRRVFMVETKVYKGFYFLSRMDGIPRTHSHFCWNIGLEGILTK